jgi:TFIIS helical bundle-like domain
VFLYIITLPFSDQEANNKKQPATNKIAMLKEAIECLRKTNFAEAFVSNGGLTAVRKWLQPLHDKSLPSLNIREQLLEILFTVCISSISLFFIYSFRFPFDFLSISFRFPFDFLSISFRFSFDSLSIPFRFPDSFRFLSLPFNSLQLFSPLSSPFSSLSILSFPFISLFFQLPFSTDQLQKSDVGKIVMFLWKSNAETPKNKRLCSQIIEKWSRPVSYSINSPGEEWLWESERR